MKKEKSPSCFQLIAFCHLCMDVAPEFFKSLRALLCSPISIPTYNPNLLCSHVVISFPTWLISQKAYLATRDLIWDVGEMVDDDLTNYFGFVIGEF